MNAHLTTLTCKECETKRAGHPNKHSTETGKETNAYCLTCRDMTVHTTEVREEMVEERS